MNREAERKRFLSARRTAGSTLPGGVERKAFSGAESCPAHKIGPVHFRKNAV